MQAPILEQLSEEYDEDEFRVVKMDVDKNPETPAVNYSAGVKLSITDDQILSELESLRIRLELEAENLIEESVTAFRAKLHVAAQEEIEYILKNSKFSDEKIEK